MSAASMARFPVQQITVKEEKLTFESVKDLIRLHGCCYKGVKVCALFLFYEATEKPPDKYLDQVFQCS